MNENNLDALVKDAVFRSKHRLISLEQAIAHERNILEGIESTMADGLGLDDLPILVDLNAAILSTLKAATELRLLVQLRRQAGRFVADENETFDGSDF
jgi:hypothetical protein